MTSSAAGASGPLGRIGDSISAGGGLKAIVVSSTDSSYSTFVGAATGAVSGFIPAFLSYLAFRAASLLAALALIFSYISL